MITGIWLDHWLDLDYRIEWMTAVCALVAWWLLAKPSMIINRVGWSTAADGSTVTDRTEKSLGSRERQRRRETMASTCLLIGWMALGAYWHHGRWNWFGANEIGTFVGEIAEPCCVEGIAITEPRWLAPTEANTGLDYQPDTIRTRVTLRVQQIRAGSQWQPVSGKLDLIIHAPTMHVGSGDAVRVFGRLASIRAPTNPGQFNFQSFYRATGKLAVLHTYYPECVQVIEPARWFHWKSLSNVRRQLNEFAWRYLNDDEAAFASAILLGNREQLSPQRRDLFLQTGTIHLLAISGLHVGILAGSFFLLFRLGLVSRRNCLWATIAFVFFYAWLVEFRPPVSRAAILIALFCWGRLLGEKNFSFNLLAIAGLMVLIINPLDLFSIGAQLSFLAVASLNFGKEWVFWPPPADPIKRLIANTRSTPVRAVHWMGRGLRTAFLVSGLIWCVALPLVALRFHLIATVGLIVNPLLLVPIAWGLYGGLGVMIFGWFLPPVAMVCGKFCQWNLALIEWMIGVAQALPFSHVWTAGPTPLAMFVFYCGLFFAAVFPPTRLRLKWVVSLAMGWFVFGWVVPDRMANYHRRHQPNPFICTFIDVGHGTGVLLQMPDGKNILYDAGSFGSSNYGFRNVAGVLWQQRIDHLDAVVISHADIDHFNALPDLGRRFPINEVIVSPQMMHSPAPAVASLMDRLQDLSIPVRVTCADDDVQESVGSRASNETRESPFAFTANRTRSAAASFIHSNISILNPPESGTGGTDNSDSIVLLIEFAGHRILLPGDLEAEGLNHLLSRRSIDCSLVMAPHHGSINSDPAEFMAWSTPESVVVSGGAHRIKEPVMQIFQQHNRSVFRTDRDGAVRYVVDQNGCSIQHWQQDHWED